MEHNVCKTCGASGGRAGILMNWECRNCHDTRRNGRVTNHTDLERTDEELARTAAIVGVRMRPAFAMRLPNLRELVEYLSEHPLVTMETDSPRIPVGGPGQNPETFLRLADGLLWFRNAQGAEHHLPLHCGLEAAALHESGVMIRDDGFDFTKFGQTIRVRYVASEPAPAPAPVPTVPRTPGPWEMIEPAAIDYRAPLVYGANGRSLVAYMEGGGPERAVTAAEARANGRFIAAAPDFEEGMAFFVLYAMRFGAADQLPPELVAWAESFRFSDRTGAEVALAAIRKTRG